MNEDQRHTLQLIVGAIYGAAIIGAVIFLTVHAAWEGHRDELLLGVLGGGFGSAVGMFLGNMQQSRRAGGGPTVNVESPQAGGQVDVNANAAPVKP